MYAVDLEPIEDAFKGLVNLITNLLGGVIGIYTYPHRLIAMGIGLGVNILTAMVAYMDGATDGNLIKPVITPFHILFNKIQLLDVNFLDVNVGGSVGNIREAVAKWYYVVRLIAITILLLILIYVGIRMAITSVASEKAIYKKSLVDWAVSLALVFLLHYIVMFTVNANSALVKVLESGMRDSAGQDTLLTGVENVILNIGFHSLGISWDSMASTVVYLMIVIQTLVFLIKYIKRMLTVGFLIMISPLISITYSIDKMGDNKAQALNTWLKEFIYNILIQPFHCVMYIAFVDVAFELLTTDLSLEAVGAQFIDNQLASAILAIVCIKFIDDGEKIVRKIFGFEQASSLGALEAAATGAALVQGGQKVAGAANNIRKGINASKEKGFLAAVRKDVDKLKTDRLANKYMKSGMEKDAAQQKAKTERANEKTKKENAKAERVNNGPISKLKQKMDDKRAKRKAEIREDQIDKQLIKDLGEERFKKLRDGADSGPEGNAAYEAARAKAGEKVDQRRANRSITGAVGKVWNSEVGKYVRKTAIPGGIGLALGGMALGGMNPLAAYSLGYAGYKGAQEFAKSSTKNIAREAAPYVRGESEEQKTEHIVTTFQKGENGVYENGSDETKDLIKKLESILIAMGQGNRKDQIITNISRDLLKSPETFDLNAILTKAVGQENAGNSKLQNAAKAFTDHKSDGYLYEQLKNGDSLGVPLSKLTSSIVRESENTSGYVRISSDPIVATQVIEHINNSESVEEVINKVEDSELRKAMYLIDNHIYKLRAALGDANDPKATAELEKFEKAHTQIQQRLTPPNPSEGPKSENS